MAKLDFPAASASPWVAPNNVIYTYIGTSPNGYWEANTANAATDLPAIFVERTGSTMTGALKLDNAGSVSLPDISFDGDVNTGLYSPSADSLGIAAGGINRLTIDIAGNVGIGTTSPASLLSVEKGNVTNRGKWSDCGIALHNPTNTGAYSQIGFGYTPSQAYASAYIGYLSTNQGSSGYGDIVFGTRNVNTDSQPTEAMRIDSSGRVGIGASDPSAGKLVITDSSNGGIGGSIILENSNNSDTDKVGIAFRPNGSATTAIGSYGESRIIGEYDSGSTNGANNLQFWTHAGNGTVGERMRIDSSGRLLVGTSSSRGGFFAGTSGFDPLFQIEQPGYSVASIIRNSNNTASPTIVLGKSRGAANGATTIVSSGDSIGEISFQAADGAKLVPAASIYGQVDGTPGSNDMPGRLVFSTTADGASSPTERLRIDSSGNVGIGTSSPSKSLQVNKSSSGGTVIQFTDSVNATGRLGTPSVGVVAFGGNPDHNIAFGGWSGDGNTFSNERMRIRSDGYVYIGDGSNNTNHRINGVNDAQGDMFLVISAYQSGGGSASDTAEFFGCATFGASTSATAIRVGKNTSTNRSINMGGTINASGADYAEYMVKCADFSIAKGDICGVNHEGQLTNQFDDAITFLVKSTDPSYVGGDTWHSNVGEKPGGRDDDRTEEEIAAAKIVYEQNLETARQKVDRIAFSGQVPVNVTDATAGQYIIPVADNDGGIVGIAKNEADLTLAEYMRAVGKVIAIEDDGRARIIVKVA